MGSSIPQLLELPAEHQGLREALQVHTPPRPRLSSPPSMSQAFEGLPQNDS
jgi:hypothetical protein